MAKKKNLQVYCPKCDMTIIPCGDANQKAEKHEDQYCIFCENLLDLYEVFEDGRDPVKIETSKQ